jgi:hypothetical protein
MIKEELINKLVDISKTFDRMHRPDYSYFVDDVIEKIARIGGDNYDGVATFTKEAAEASQRKIIKSAYLNLMEISDSLEFGGLYGEAVELDKVRAKLLKEFDM